MTRYTSRDVEQKLDLINARLRELGARELFAQSSNPDGNQRRYEFAGWIYLGAGEACRALDAIMYALPLPLTEKQAHYVTRAIDVARSDPEAAALLSPVERDELLAHFGGRR
jgi:hypothetical protein